MSKGYVIASITVTNAAVYGEYIKASSAAIAKFGGRPIVSGGSHVVVEGEGRARNVVIEFDSFEIAQAYYNSPDYQAAIKIREHAGRANIVIVEGA